MINFYTRKDQNAATGMPRILIRGGEDWAISFKKKIYLEQSSSQSRNGCHGTSFRGGKVGA